MVIRIFQEFSNFFKVVLLTFDCHYMHNIDLLRDWIEDVKIDNPDVIFALVGTRSDKLVTGMKTITNYDKINELKEEFGITIMHQTSAKLGSNVNVLFEDIVESFAWRYLNKYSW
jgi:hypothetical protein